jgi:hypothetical protein
MPITKSEVNKEQVYRYIGCGTDYRASARVSSLVDEYAENVYQLIEQSYSYVIRDIKHVWGSTIVIEGSVVFQSRVISRLLKHCRKVGVFLVTIGEHLEEMSYRLSEEGLILQAALLDAIGSDVVEKAADFVQDKIKEEASAQGLVTSLRFSPGYCDWDISQQRMLFRAMKGDLAGICLTKQCLMIPRKSISGIIGIGPPGANVENYNPCKTCRKRDCPSRREI